MYIFNEDKKEFKYELDLVQGEWAFYINTNGNENSLYHIEAYIKQFLVHAPKNKGVCAQ